MSRKAEQTYNEFSLIYLRRQSAGDKAYLKQRNFVDLFLERSLVSDLEIRQKRTFK